MGVLVLLAAIPCAIAVHILCCAVVGINPFDPFGDHKNDK